ncbi:hypothetical protein L0337_24725 [candidate division KSB1 bacterium]|nr:hypothetical protein [candidate division KSB1 bacterium]
MKKQDHDQNHRPQRSVSHTFGSRRETDRARVEELRKCWEQVISSRPPQSVLVNLTDLTEIDSEGKELLAQVHHQGAKLIGSGVMIEALIEEIERGQDD